MHYSRPNLIFAGAEADDLFIRCSCQTAAYVDADGSQETAQDGHFVRVPMALAVLLADSGAAATRVSPLRSLPFDLTWANVAWSVLLNSCHEMIMIPPIELPTGLQPW